jgi:hypothetical protein
LRLQNKTLTPPTNKKDGWAGSKTAFRKGAESSFCLWQALKSTNEKIARESDNSEVFLKMARLYAFARTYFATKREK